MGYAVPLPPDAKLVRTGAFTAAHRALEEIMRHRGCLEIVGEGGTGKTFCVDRFAETTKHRIVKLHLEERVRGNGFLRRLVHALDGKDTGSGQALLGELRRVVADQRIYVYVDEADLLLRDALRHVRYLRDQRELHLAFVLVGSDFTEAYALAPELWSRVTRRVSFSRIPKKRLRSTLRDYHPLFGTAEPDLLEAIDEEYCGGLWRTWANLLETCLEYLERMGADKLTEAVASAALGAMADGSPAPIRRGRGSRPGG